MKLIDIAGLDPRKANHVLLQDCGHDEVPMRMQPISGRTGMAPYPIDCQRKTMALIDYWVETSGNYLLNGISKNPSFPRKRESILLISTDPRFRGVTISGLLEVPSNHCIVWVHPLALQWTLGAPDFPIGNGCEQIGDRRERLDRI